MRAVPTVLDDPAVGVFTPEEFERAWQLDASAPTRARVVPDTTIVVTRNAPDDFQDRQIYLWVDDEPLGKIRYGCAVTKKIEPGVHKVRAFNTLFTREITVDAAPGEEVRVRCGMGLPTAGWLMMAILQVSFLRVWLEREPVRR